MNRSAQRLLAGVLFSATVTAAMPVNAEQSPLVKIAQDLHCASSEQRAVELLEKLAKLPLEPFGVPSENLSNTPDSELYAATVDILLHVLYEITQRYPNLQESAEQIALLWNYCDIINDGDLADLLASRQEGIIKREALGPFPANKQGFQAWGFTQYANSHHVPDMLKRVPLYPRAFQDLLHRLTTQQCFPHPDIDTQQNGLHSKPYGGSLHLLPALEPGKKYPFLWHAECAARPTDHSDHKQYVGTKNIPAETTQYAHDNHSRHKKTTDGHQHPVQKHRDVAKFKTESHINHTAIENGVSEEQLNIDDFEITPDELQVLTPSSDIDLSQAVTSIQSTTKAIKKFKLRSKLTRQPKIKLKPKLATKKITQKKITQLSSKKAILDRLFAKYTPPTDEETQGVATAIPPSSDANVGPPLPLPPKNGWGLAGNFYHRAKLTGAMSLGANINWKPYSYFFARGGVNYTYLPGSGQFSYSWGIGYDDWHAGTFSAQLNNWGPITDGNSFFSGVAANIGYKFKAEFLKPYHIGGSAALTIPLSGNPSLSTTWVWTPVEHWFVRASLSAPLTDPSALSWSYGFGYSDSRPFKFSLTYDNWGSNPILNPKQGDLFNFVENGAISLSWGWAF